MKSKWIANGLSRNVYLLENGMIMKKPNYDYYYVKIGLGSASEEGFFRLMKENKDNPHVKKVKQMMKEGRFPYASCRNTFVEYMLSLMFNEREKQYFALCYDVRVRRSPTNGKISIVGFYENAKTKQRTFNDNRGPQLFAERTGYVLEDLHSGNYVNGLIVDYAALWYS